MLVSQWARFLLKSGNINNAATCCVCMHTVHICLTSIFCMLLLVKYSFGLDFQHINCVMHSIVIPQVGATPYFHGACCILRPHVNKPTDFVTIFYATLKLTSFHIFQGTVAKVTSLCSAAWKPWRGTAQFQATSSCVASPATRSTTAHIPSQTKATT